MSVGPPTPTVPAVALPGLAFIQATVSLRLLAGKLARAAIHCGVSAISVTGSKSLHDVVGQIQRRAVDDVGLHVAERERVAVRRRAGHAADADAAAGAGDVLDDDRLARASP